MGTKIEIEVNKDLALRAHGTSGRGIQECLPKSLKVGRAHSFLKEGMRNYQIQERTSLKETKGSEQLSEPLAEVRIMEYTHFLLDKKPHTRGIYVIEEIYDGKSKQKPL